MSGSSGIPRRTTRDASFKRGHRTIRRTRQGCATPKIVFKTVAWPHRTPKRQLLEKTQLAESICQTVGGQGADILQGGEGADRISAGQGRDRLLGNAGSDSLVGGGGADRLDGGGGSDEINGQAGSDWLIGQGGCDALNG